MKATKRDCNEYSIDWGKGKVSRVSEKRAIWSWEETKTEPLWAQSSMGDLANVRRIKKA